MSPRNILSWVGYESHRKHLQQLASNYRDADLKLETESSNACDAMVRAWKNPSSRDSEQAITTASAFAELLAYQKHLTQELGVNYHLVRGVTSVILNPHPEEIKRCKQNIQEERIKAGIMV